MASVTRSYTFTDGTTAYGSQVETDFGTIYTAWNNHNSGTSQWEVVSASSQVRSTATTNQLLLGTTRTVTITAPTPASSSRTWTIPDRSGDMTFSGLEATETHTGTKTFVDGGLLLRGSDAAFSITIRTAAFAAARDYTVPDAGAAASFVMTAGTQTVGGAKTFSSALTISASSGNVLVVNTSSCVVDATNSRVGIGTASPSYPLHINKTGIQIASTNIRAIAHMNLDSGDASGIILGYNSSTGEGVVAGATAATGQGIEFWTFNGAAWAARMTLAATGGLQMGAPTGGDKGSGTINAAGDIYKNDSAYTNPDYVLEHWATGTIERFKENLGASQYPGALPLKNLESYMRENLDLPGVKERFRDASGGQGIFARADIALEKIEEAFIYLVELNKRLELVEGKTGS